MATVTGTFDDNADNESEFRVYRTTASSPSFPGDYSQIKTLAADTTSFTDDNAPSGQTVHYAVTAYNEGGESSETTASIETVVAPSTPQNLTSSVNGDDISLDWDPVDWGGDQGHYEILRGQESGTLSQIDTVAAGTTTYTDTGLEDGERFWYAVRAQNSEGTSGTSNETSESTVISAPTIGTPYADANSNVVVPWTKNDDSSDGGWDVERSTDGGASWTTVAAGLSPSTTEYTGASVPDTATYTYRVRRVTDHESERSGTVDVYVDYVVTITSTNSPISAGETLDVQVDVTNQGTIEGDQAVELIMEEQ
jgi:hypothetical protein